MNLFAIIINSEMLYFIDATNTEKNHLLNEYISTYHIPQNGDINNTFNTLIANIRRDLNIVLTPIKLIDIYRPQIE